MTIFDILTELAKLDDHSKELDAEIAQLMGWAPIGAQDISRAKLLLRPDGTRTDKHPRYTRYIDHALEIIQEHTTDAKIGLSWERGTATAKVGDGPYVQAPTPALAICLAGLSLVAGKRDQA